MRRGSIFIPVRQWAESWPLRFLPSDLRMVVTACYAPAVIG